MPKFFTSFDLPPHTRSASGEAVEVTYGYRDNNGRREIGQVGTRDLVALHQENAEECDIKTIVERATYGDQVAIERLQGWKNSDYIDATGLPTDFLGAQQLINAGDEAFNSLPLALRRDYGFDKMTFLESYELPEDNSKSFKARISRLFPQTVKTKETLEKSKDVPIKEEK